MSKCTLSSGVSRKLTASEASVKKIALPHPLLDAGLLVVLCWSEYVSDHTNLRLIRMLTGKNACIDKWAWLASAPLESRIEVISYSRDKAQASQIFHCWRGSTGFSVCAAWALSWRRGIYEITDTMYIRTLVLREIFTYDKYYGNHICQTLKISK